MQKSYAQSNGFDLFEIFPNKNYNINVMFETLVTKILKQRFLIYLIILFIKRIIFSNFNNKYNNNDNLKQWNLDDNIIMKN